MLSMAQVWRHCKFSLELYLTNPFETLRWSILIIVCGSTYLRRSYSGIGIVSASSIRLSCPLGLFSVSACRLVCGSTTWCTNWSSGLSMECSCINSSFFSPYGNGTKCESCSGSCPKSVEQLKTAIICLAVLAAAVLTSTIVISIMFCRSQRTGLPHLKQLKSHARAFANNSRAASQYAVELEAKKQHLAVLLQSVRQRRVDAHRLRGENTEFLSSGLHRMTRSVAWTSCSPCWISDFVATGEYEPESLIPELTDAEDLGIMEETGFWCIISLRVAVWLFWIELPNVAYGK